MLSNNGEFKPPKVEDIFIFGDVFADDTMREWNQHLEYLITTRQPHAFEIIVDRIHKKDIKLSRPVCWLQFSEMSQMVELVAMSMRSLLLYYYADVDYINLQEASDFLGKMLDKIKIDVLLNIQLKHKLLRQQIINHKPSTGITQFMEDKGPILEFK